MSALLDRWLAVQQAVHNACLAANRDPQSVRLIAVSKVHSIDAIREVHTAGQLDFGESYAQELRDKARELPAPSWHFIGRIQRNKARYIAPVAHRVHALESVAQAEALAKRSPTPLSCLVSVNVGRETQKTGVLPEELPARLDALAEVQNIRLVGLMTLPPAVASPNLAAPFFEEVADLAVRGRARGHALDELSMGMSHDFATAIAHGATWVRVGTAIFGPRPTAR